MVEQPFEEYLNDRSRRGAAPDDAFTGAAGGAPCGDLVRVSLTVIDGAIRSAAFDAAGCGAAIAAGAAVTAMVEGACVLDAARIGPGEISAELGGLSAGKFHAADLAADALHRALTALTASGCPLVSGSSPDRVLVAMSGGVDSAVAALLEREAGREVIAVTLKLWSDPVTDGAQACCSPQAVLSARALSHSLGLSHLTMDLEGEFRAGVVAPFVAGYAEGRTPNPCVLCNGEVRIDAMIELAGRLGAAALATGHYARIADDGEGPLLTAPADAAKDQGYMLSALAPASLAHLRFPLARLTKPEVRQIAAQAGLPVATKRESQDLCFLAGEGKRAFLARHADLTDTPGEVVDTAGRVLGRHRGHHQFTVGQRRGLGVASTEPLFVLAKDADSNRVVAGSRDQLATSRVRIERAVLHRDPARVNRVKLRYRSRSLACRVEGHQREPLTLALDERAEGVAPGQNACLLDGDLIVGWGTIAA